MATETRARGQGKTPSRSVRVADSTWTPAQRRAAYEGVALSYVITSFLEAYGQGKINVPQKVIVPSASSR